MSPARKPATGGKGSSKTTKTTRKKTPKSSATKKVAKKSTRRGAAATKKKPPATKSAAKARAKKPSSAKTSKKTSTRAPVAKATSRDDGKKRARKKTVTRAPVEKAGTGSAVESKPTQAKPQAKKMVIRKPLPKPPPSRKPRPAKLDKESLDKIKAQLRQERADLRRQQEELEVDSFEGSQSDLSGEVGLDEDFADAGTATFDRERDLSIRNNIRDLIEQIDRALTRIEDGSYGTCERCGQPIDAARLKALPHASLCLDCKRRDERVR